MKHRFWKRLTALVLSLCLLLGAMPLQALAAVSQTKHNSVAENQAILEKLQALTGSQEEASAALAAMRDMGLVDEDGNLLQTEKVTLNGQEMTLDQVKDYIAGCDEGGLSQTVDIDGTEVSLENLSVMLAIEEQMDLLREFFNDEAPDLTPEQQASLESLANQLQTQGITLQNQAAVDGSYEFASGVDHSAQVSMSLYSTTWSEEPTDTGIAITDMKAWEIYAKFTLNHEVDRPVTFTLYVVDGSAIAGLNYAAFPDLTGEEEKKEQTITIPAGTKEFEIKVAQLIGGNNSWDNENPWRGDKVFFIQATDISGALFANGAHSVVQSVTLRDNATIQESDFKTSVVKDLFQGGVNNNPIYNTSPWQPSASFGGYDKYFVKNCATDLELMAGIVMVYWPWGRAEAVSGGGNLGGEPWYWLLTANEYQNDQAVYTDGMNENAVLSTLTYAKYGILYNGTFLNDYSKEIGYRYVGKTGNVTEENQWKEFSNEWKEFSKANPSKKGSKLEDLASELHIEKVSDDMQLAGTTVEYSLPTDKDELIELRSGIAARGLTMYLDTEICAVGYNKSTGQDYVFTEEMPRQIIRTLDENSEVDIGTLLTITDERPPMVVDVAASKKPNGEKYSAGEIMPITVTFDGPVKVTGNETLLVNKSVDDDGTVKTEGTQCKIVESPGTITRTVTFLYEVQAGDSIGLRINEISPFTDTANNENKEAQTLEQVVDNVVDNTIPHWAAIAGVDTDATGTDASNKEYLPGTESGLLTVSLTENTDVKSWLSGKTDPTAPLKLEGYEGYFKSTALAASLDGGQTMIDLYIDQDATQLVGVMSFAVDLENSNTYAVELFDLMETAPEEGQLRQPMFGLYTGFTIPAPVFLDGEDDLAIVTPNNWPDEEGEEGYTTENGELTLGISVLNTKATWQDTDKVGVIKNGQLVEDIQNPDAEYDFAWSSSNENVATIDGAGNITVLAKGTVHFTLTALNGDLTWPATETETEKKTWWSVDTVDITVGVGNSPFLTVPESVRTVQVREGMDATVVWSTNLTEKNRDYALGKGDMTEEQANALETTYTIKIYKAADWNATEGKPNENAKPVSSGETKSSMADVRSSYTIPAGTLKYSPNPYYAVISSEYEGKPYSDWAKIQVLSPPAVITLERPKSLFITDDTKSLNLNWSLENYTSTGSFELTITNSSNPNVSTGDDAKTNENGGSYSMTIEPVTNGYRDVYTVQVAAKNAEDSTWSYDSFVLYVYNKEVLETIYVDEDSVDGSYDSSTKTLNLTNQEKDYITALASAQKDSLAGKDDITSTEQQTVWDNREDIALTADISMDPTQPWLEVPDQFAWNATDEEGNQEGEKTHATINYQQGALYEDITRYTERTSYGPLSEFRLSGLSDGDTTVTATHVNTGTAAELAVKVDTLKDKLYLFQISPTQLDTLTLKYTNGDKVEKNVTGIEGGKVAVYEESGILGDVYIEGVDTKNKVTYFGTIYHEDLVSSEKDSTQLELYPVNYMTLRKAAQVPIYLKEPDGTPYTGSITVHAGVYVNDVYASGAKIDTNDNQGHDGVAGYTIESLGTDGSHTFTFDMTQFDTEGRDVSEDPIGPDDNVQFVFQIEAEGFKPLLVRVNSAVNEEDAIAAGDRIITLTEAPADEPKSPFAAQQTLYYGENKYGYSSDVLGVKGKLGPGDTYQSVELETMTLWWGQEKDATALKMEIQDEYRMPPKNQSCEVVEYPFTTMPVTRHSLKLNKETMTGWLDTLDSTRIDMVYSVNNKETKREDPSFRIINMLGSGDVSTWDRLGAMMNDTAKAGELSNGKGKVNVSNALVTLGISMATSFGLSADSLTMKVVPTEDPTVFRGIFLIGLNNMIGDNVSKIDPDTSQVDDLDYMPGREDLTKLVSMGTEGYFQDQANRIDNAQKLLKNNVSTKSKGNDYSYMLKGGFETEIYYDYDARQWKMVVVTGQLNVGGGFGQTWCFNSFCGPVPITAELGYGIALSVQFGAAVDRTVMLNDYLTLIQLNAFIRAFAGIGFDYAILAMKIGLFGQLSFEGAIKVLNAKEQQAQVGYKVDFDGEVGIEFLVRFLFISYERILWSMKIDIAEGQSKNWEDIDEYWEGVKNGKSENDWQMITGPETQALRSTQQAELLAADSTTGTALYASPSTATLESRDYLDNPRTYGSTMTMLRARANTLSGEETGGNEENLIENAYPAGEPMVSEDGGLLAFVHDHDSTELEKTKASYVLSTTITKSADVKPFPDPKTTTEGEVDDGVSTQASNSDQVVGGDSQLRLAGESGSAVAAWTRVTETLKKEPGSDVTSDEQMLMMNSTEIFASVRSTTDTDNEHDGWVTTQLTDNTSADMAPAVATNGSKALVAWRAVAASDSGKVTTFDTNDTILYRIYDSAKANDENGGWSKTYTLYNGTSGAVKGIEAQMMTDGTMAVAYTIDKGADKGNNGSSTTAEEETDGSGTYLLSDLQTVIAIVKPDAAEGYKVTTNVQVTNDNDVNENPQLTVVKFPANGTAGQTEEETFVLGWYSIHDEDGVQKNDIRLVAMNKNGAIRGDFVDSLSAINSQVGSTITSTFRFVKNADGLGSLSILWSQPTLDTEDPEFGDEEEDAKEPGQLGDADGDVLMGVRFRVEGNKLVGLTAPIQLTSMAESCTIESFDGWLSDAGIKAVVLSTQYGVKDEKGDTFHVEEIPGVGDDELQKVYIQNEQTNLRLITGQYEDTISVDTPLPDYEALLAGTDIIPIQTTVTNMGTQAITSLTFTVGEGENASSVTLDDEDGLNLQPGESQILTVNYEVKKDANNQITCPTYSVSATFGNSGTPCQVTGEQEIYLNVPSLGVSQVETVQQAEGDRVIQFSLYNLSPSKLAGSGRQVKVGLFTDPDTDPTSEETSQVGSQYVTFEQVETGTFARNGDGTFTVDTDDLALIDQGGYLLQATVHLQKYANENDKDNGYLEEKEIRENGINFYVKAWVADDEGNELGEVHTGDNVRAVTFQSLLELTGQEFTTTADLTQEDDKTKVDLTIQNNSLQSVNASGDEMKKVIYVNLLDENGNVLETQETKNIATWEPEGSQNLQLSFNQAGTQVSYFFGDRTTGTSGDLTNITLDKIPFQFEEGQISFTVQAPQDLEETVLGLAFASGSAKATVNGKPYDVNENRTISLGSGTTVINIVVTDEDGTTKNYQITITKGNTGGGGTVTRPTYPPVIPDAEHGSVSVNPTRPHQGDKVTITATPDEGYVVGEVTVTKANGEKVAVTDLGNGKYTFTQPSGKVTIDVTFIPEGWPFVDVAQGDWYYDAVKYVYEHSIMVGMSGTTFEPETSLNRGMVVQMLYNLEGKPAVTSENPFTDVHSTQWWYDAVRWGAANKVVAGYGDGKFLPEQNISRQEFAQMLYNYAKYKGYDLTAAGDLSKFPDGDETASWAKTALSWANGFELINGFEDETLRPQATTTRAQAASILMKFDQNVTK